jgi:tetratricopeptide (TPR) repeat protein
LLTGRPPYTGGSQDTLLGQACQADLSECLARLGASGADSELIAIAAACLARKADDRPGDARGVADRVAAYRAVVQVRARQAEVDAAVARVNAQQAAFQAARQAAMDAELARVREEQAGDQRAAERTRRRVRRAGVAVLVGGFVTAVGVAVGAYRQEQRTAAALVAVTAEQEKSAAALVKLTQKQLEADAALAKLREKQQQAERADRRAADAWVENEIRQRIAEIEVEVQTRASGKRPNDPGARDSLSVAHVANAEARIVLGQVEKAVQALRDAREQARAWVELSGERPPPPDRVAGRRLRIGEAFAKLERWDEARSDFRTAHTTLAPIAADHPDLQARCQLGLGRAWLSTRPLASVWWYDAALRTLAKIDPAKNARRHRAECAECYAGRADALGRLNCHALAVADLDRAEQSADGPDGERFRVDRVMARLRAGQRDEARAEADKLSRSASLHPGEWLTLARVYAVASTLWPDQQEECATRAVDLLTKAVAGGLTIKADTDPRTHSDFAKFHDRADFKAAVAGLPKSSISSGGR